MNRANAHIQATAQNDLNHWVEFQLLNDFAGMSSVQRGDFLSIKAAIEAEYVKSTRDAGATDPIEIERARVMIGQAYIHAIHKLRDERGVSFVDDIVNKNQIN